MPEVTIKLADLPKGQVHIECVCKPDIKEDGDPTPAQAVAMAIMQFINDELGSAKKLEPKQDE